MQITERNHQGNPIPFFLLAKKSGKKTKDNQKTKKTHLVAVEMVPQPALTHVKRLSKRARLKSAWLWSACEGKSHPNQLNALTWRCWALREATSNIAPLAVHITDQPALPPEPAVPNKFKSITFHRRFKTVQLIFLRPVKGAQRESTLHLFPRSGLFFTLNSGTRMTTGP